jgi:hypothetical protein
MIEVSDDGIGLILIIITFVIIGFILSKHEGSGL